MAKLSFDMQVDVSALEALAERVGQMDEDAFAEFATKAVNETANFAYDTTKKGMLAGLTLTDAYISRKMELNLAKPSTRPRAVVLAKDPLTTLGHYAPRIETTAVKNPSRSKGWAAAGIPKGQKITGVSVEVTRGNRQSLPGTFVLPGLKDYEQNPLIFYPERFRRVNPKTGRAVVESRLGPSVYQLFKFQYDKNAEGITDDLRDGLVEYAEAAFKKALE